MLKQGFFQSVPKLKTAGMSRQSRCMFNCGLTVLLIRNKSKKQHTLNIPKLQHKWGLAYFTNEVHANQKKQGGITNEKYKETDVMENC